MAEINIDALMGKEKKKKSVLQSIVETMGIGPTQVESVKDVGSAALDLGILVGDYIPDPIIQGSKVVGSGFMDAMNVLDKLRGGAAGVWDVAGEYGPKITRDKRSGEYDMENLFTTDWFGRDGSVVEDQSSFIDRVMESAKQGWKDPSTKSFGDEFTSLYPDWLSKVPGSKFVGDVAANIGGDPLTYMPTAFVSVPARLIWSAIKWGGGNKLAATGPVKSVLEALNVYTGDAKEAQKLINDLRLEQQGSETLTARAASELNEQLSEIAMRAGVSVPELKSAITEAIESGDMSELSALKGGSDAVRIVDSEIQFYQDILAAEKAAGRNIEDIAARGIDPDTGKVIGLGISETGYITHQAGEKFDKTLTSKLVRLLSPPKAIPEHKRGIEGTIREINERKGRAFFMDDPVVLKVMRKRWSDNALAADRLFNRAADDFGKKVSKRKDGVRVDPDGVVIPDEWVTVRGVAFPPEFARIITKQEKILNNPAEAKRLIKIFDEVQTWWKKYTLGLRPAWHTRNAFGNFWNAYLIGGLTDPLRYGEAAAIQKSMQVGKGKVVGASDYIVGKITGKALDKAAEVRGTGMTREEIFNEAVKRGVYESGMYGQDVGTGAARSSNIPGSTEWSGINKAFAAGKTVENNARLALFIDSIAKGVKAAGRKGKTKFEPAEIEKILDDASINVRKSLFDYGDLSDVEKRIMKRVAPFYTWTRKNIPAQLQAIALHPDRANKLNILVAGLQSGVPRIDSNDIDEWVKDQYPIFFNAEDSEQAYTFMTALSYLPTAELNRIFQDPKGFAYLFAQMGTPLLKIPMEIIFNYDTFREKPIDVIEYERGSKFGEGIFKSVPGLTGSQDFLGIKVTPHQKHLLQALVLLGEVDRLNPFNIFGTKEKKSWLGATRHGHDLLESSRWIRAMTGARLYKRQKGSATAKKAIQIQSDFNYLKKKLKENKVKSNPDLYYHLLRQLEEITQGQ